MNKSFVTLESKLCMTCGCEYSTGDTLLDTKMRNQFERDTVTGWGLCDAHTQAAKEGMVALIEVDASKSTPEPDGSIMPNNAYRTGRHVLVKRDGLRRAMLGIVIPDGCAFIFIDIDAFNKLLPPEVLANAPKEPERSTTGHVTAGPSSIN